METLSTIKFGLAIAVLIVGVVLAGFCGYCKLLAKKESQNDDFGK
ncbi:MAG: hypothetical protein WA140_08195 [Geobacteraceae bacterium]